MSEHYNYITQPIIEWAFYITAPTIASSQVSTPQMHACVQCFGKHVCNACIWIIASRCDTTPACLGQ
jgi:hypothetical protein